jgi:hypothetical protein
LPMCNRGSQKPEEGGTEASVLRLWGGMDA